MALRDYSLIKPENIRQTAVPLSIDSIKEFFENKELFFVVDYAQSKIKGNMFLTYLSNLDLPCEIQLTGSSIEEKFELLRVYMETRNLNPSDALKLTVADIILTYKGVPTDGLFHNPALTADEKKQFAEANPELLRKWDQFLSSCMVYLIKAFPDLNQVLKVEGQFREVLDPDFIGANVVHLFGIPGFTELFFSAKCTEELCYFKLQFEEYMFRGKNFFHYFCCEENSLFLLMNAVLNGRIKPQDVVDFVTAKEA